MNHISNNQPNNEIIKHMLKEKGIPQWKLADSLLISEQTLHRRLRKPLPENVYKLYVETIAKTS